MRRGVWGALSAWQDEKGAQWVLVPFWGPVSTPVQGAHRARAPDRWRRRGIQARRARRQMAAHARVALARHGSRGGSGHRQRRRVRLRRRRGCDAGHAGSWHGTNQAVRFTAAGSARARRAAFRPRAAPRSTRSTGRPGRSCGRAATQIESWNHFSGLTVANGRAYIATFDGVLYCFGVAR